MNKFLKKDMFRVLKVIGVSLITYYLTLYPVNKVGEIIDRLGKNNIDKTEFTYQVIYLFGMAILLYLVFYFKEWYIFIGEYEAQNDIGLLALDKVYNKTSEFFNKIHISKVISIIINDITSYISLFFSLGLLFFVEGVIYNIILTMVILYKSNFILTFLIIIPYLLQSLFIIFKRKKQSKDYKIMIESLDNIVDSTLEFIKGIRVIRAYNMVEVVREKFIININNYADNLLVYVLNYAILQPLILVSKSFSYLALVIYGYYLVSIGETSIGNLVSISIITAMLSWPYAALSELILRIIELKGAVKRAKQILVEKENNVSKKELKKFKFDEKIIIKNLTYEVSGKKVLDDINLEIKKGQTVAIVGKTGSGKTTLIKVLLSILEATKGEIYIDDNEIKKYNIKDIRNNISYVPQQYMLFSKSIKENILFYSDLENRLDEVIKIVDLEKDISKLDKGLDTHIGENGLSLSGGQKQRIQIARALIREPEILILDDSFSAIDTNTEKKILNNINSVRKEKTNIIISHKISVIKNADIIFVMSNGKIVDKGKHTELINKSGWYKQLYEHQYLVGDKNE
ncbi:ABC transporter ATP-binding protein [Oceanivirga salmonicida]|uniref:ABC transporter ATP-binding protein n=1 Tax=Oceanivirga salmonicida TaxID=1769291 RepID=UPI00082BAE78|nr:ABC transporter ATP-binding protein [Oceanivirga salmonicida]